MFPLAALATPSLDVNIHYNHTSHQPRPQTGESKLGFFKHARETNETNFHLLVRSSSTSMEGGRQARHHVVTATGEKRRDMRRVRGKTPPPSSKTTRETGEESWRDKVYFYAGIENPNSIGVWGTTA